MALTVAYARVSTSSGEQRSALDAQIAWLQAQGPDVLLSDVESGRVITRPNYQQLRSMVERGQVVQVIATALSRLGRDATESDAFVALCDARGVVVLTRDDGRLSMATPEDLLLTRLKGSLSQGESMRISQRVRQGLKQGRAMGKPMRKPCCAMPARCARPSGSSAPSPYPQWCAWPTGSSWTSGMAGSVCRWWWRQQHRRSRLHRCSPQSPKS